MSARLAEVIQNARHTYGMGQNPDTWMWEVTDRYGPTLAFKLPADAENYLNSRITAAVVAHLASPEVVERARDAVVLSYDRQLRARLSPSAPAIEIDPEKLARAALAAAVGGDGTEGR